ncbi:MAG: MFS transporter [Victivallales bacterium]
MSSSSTHVYKVGTLVYSRASLFILFLWLLWGDLCYTLMETVIPSIMPLKLKALGATNVEIGIILISMPMTITALTNPIISFKSDRFRSKWGRRIPFLFFSMPLLCLALLGVGLGDWIAHWLHPMLGALTSGLSVNQLAIYLIAFMMVFFSIFNMFLNTTFWYLFKDVVPEELLARFISWFRFLSVVVTSLYSVFIFRYAETYSAWIMIGAAILYLVGFGLLCLNVKEGQYPPSPPYINGKKGVLAALETYWRECHCKPIYVYLYLAFCFWSCNTVVGIYLVFFTKSIGMNLEQIGYVNGAMLFTSAILLIGSGWLADKYHPIRVVIAGLLLLLLVVHPAFMLWLFFTPSQTVSFYLYFAFALFLSAPALALMGILDPAVPLFIFPSERVGQFCSANGMWRAIAGIIGAAVSSFLLDFLIRHLGENRAYKFIYVWQWIFTALTLFCVLMVYKHWEKMGGDKNYVAAMRDFSEAE